MSLRDLQYLVAIARYRHFGKAADSCHVSQPTLSGQIQKLEQQLGVTLLERNNRQVHITEVGQQIVEIAQRMLQDDQQIRVIAAQAGDPLAGELKLGAFPTLAPYYFAQAIGQLRQALPKLTLTLIEEKTNNLIALLKQGDIDAALLALPVSDDYFRVQSLFEDKFVVALPEAHPLMQKEAIAESDLQPYPLLLLEEGHCFRDQALEICHARHIQEDKSFRATGLETLRQMVIAGMGITFMPQMAATTYLPGICYRPFAGAAPRRQIALVWRKISARQDLMVKIADILAKDP